MFFLPRLNWTDEEKGEAVLRLLSGAQLLLHLITLFSRINNWINGLQFASLGALFISKDGPSV